MLVYNYDSITKEFINSQEACLNVPATRREGKNVYLLPANATFKKVPNLGEHETALFENEKWKKYPDYRGTYIVNEEMNVIYVRELGQIPEGYIVITPTQAQTIMADSLYYIIENGQLVPNPHYNEDVIANAKQIKYEENDQKASSARYSQEFTLTIQDEECVFDTNQTTQADLLTAFAVCSTGATYDGWVTNNGIVINLTMEDVVLISTVFKEKSNVYGKWNEYKHAIDEAQTLEEVESIIINYGDEE